jgi:hypothetical protein
MTYELDDLKTPCNMIFSGSTMCGKTTLLRKLLKQLIPKHDMTLVLAPTANVSKDYEEYKSDERFQVRHKKIGERLKELIEKQRELVENKGKDKASGILLILDDCLGDKSLAFGGELDHFSTKSRHYKISIIILTQSLRRVPHTFRMNTRYIMAFSSANFKELEAILEEFCPKKYKKKFTDQLPLIYDKPFTFVFCQCFITSPQQRLWVVNPDFTHQNIVEEILTK